jgi:anaphase-promoting complex subunit 5
MEIALSRIDAQIRRQNYAKALSLVEAHGVELAQDRADIYQRVRVMTMKALILDKIGRPQKGFTVAMRAAAIALRARLMPALWWAIGAITNIMSHLREFAAATRLMESIMPQVGHIGSLIDISY